MSELEPAGMSPAEVVLEPGTLKPGQVVHLHAEGSWEEYSAMTPAEMAAEFESYPEEARLAALEYARGLALPGAGDAAARDVFRYPHAPQFVIVGLDGGTVVFSEHVSEARMVRKVDGYDRVPVGPGGPVARVPRWAIALGVKLEQFEQHLGEDYPSALDTLAAEWRRRRAGIVRPPELPPGIS